jgi:plasmid stabilization system protein ParE
VSVDDADDEPRRYVVRLTDRARGEIERAYEGLRDAAGVRVADEWQDGLVAALRTLSTFPQRCPLIPEAGEFTREVRHLLYRRPRSGRSSPVHRLLYFIQEDEQDAPRVFIVHVRHGAAAPLTEEDARSIEQDAA